MLYLQTMYLFSMNSLIYHTFLLPKYLLQKIKKFKNVKFQYFLQVGGSQALVLSVLDKTIFAEATGLAQLLILILSQFHPNK